MRLLVYLKVFKFKLFNIQRDPKTGELEDLSFDFDLCTAVATWEQVAISSCSFLVIKKINLLLLAICYLILSEIFGFHFHFDKSQNMISKHKYVLSF